MRLARVRFEGEIRFPGLARNTTTFDAADGYTITLSPDRTFVGVDRIVDEKLVSIVVPWSRVVEGVPEPVDPADLRPMMDAVWRNGGNYTPTSAEPAPESPARRARRKAPAE